MSRYAIVIFLQRMMHDRSFLFQCNVVTVDPQVLLELFSMYNNWQDERVQKINKNQVCSIKKYFDFCMVNANACELRHHSVSFIPVLFPSTSYLL